MKVERETVLELINDLLRERDALRSNLASVQARCTSLLDEVRALRRGARLGNIYDELSAALRRAEMKHGTNFSFPDGTGTRYDAHRLQRARDEFEWARQSGTLTKRHILEEEYCEIMAAKSRVHKRAELVDTAVVILRWIEQLDREMDACESEDAEAAE